jgi:hypothetical protein
VEAEASPADANNGVEAPAHSKERESLPQGTASHPLLDLDVQARVTVEGCGYDGHASDPEAVLCTRWAETMEAV